MTLTEGETRVRYLLDQTSSTNTQFDNTNFIDHALNQGRRQFASILPERAIPKLRKSVALVVAAGVGTYPTDFLRILEQPYVTVDAIIASRIPESQRWRLRYLESNTYVASSTTEKYFYETSAGVKLLPATSAACVYEYIMIPTALAVAENYELPKSVDDLVVDFAFEKCMGTRRGDTELAGYLLRKYETTLGKM